MEIYCEFHQFKQLAYAKENAPWFCRIFGHSFMRKTKPFQRPHELVCRRCGYPENWQKIPIVISSDENGPLAGIVISPVTSCQKEKENAGNSGA